VKAVNAMVKGQQHVLVVFVMCAVVFNISLVGIYFTNMDIPAAIVSSVINIIGLFTWYVASLRIYNRFKFQAVKLAVSDDGLDDDETVDEDSTNQPKKENDNKTDNDNSDKLKETLLPKPKNTLSSLFRFKSSKPVQESTNFNNKQPSEFSNKHENCRIKGYITLKEEGLLSVQWKRRYATLKHRTLNYYSDQRDFELQPDKPLNKRPITFEGYMVDEDITEDHYELTIAPIDPDDNQKIWEFRCDTLDELALWRDALRETIKASNIDGEYLPPPPITSNATIFNE
jgi:hypothetical protein